MRGFKRATDKISTNDDVMMTSKVVQGGKMVVIPKTIKNRF